MFFDVQDYQSLSTREGLNSYLGSAITRPARLTTADYAQMSASERENYNRQRMRHLSSGVFIKTPQVIKSIVQTQRLLLENAGKNSGHGGLMLSGDSTLGKTTITKAIMREVHRGYRKRFPHCVQEGLLPVVYVEVPPGSTGKALISRIAEFLGITVMTRDTMETVMTRVVAILNQVDTRLVVVDEVHNLNKKTSGNGESVDLLKSLHNRLPATFIYSGINLVKGGLMMGERGRQLSGRFVLQDLQRFTRATEEDKSDWLGLIKTFESELFLLNHEPEELLPLSDYLHERTNGSIGSLGRLLTGAAMWQIHQGVPPSEEKLTQELLDDWTIDASAERSRAGNGPAPRARSGGEATHVA